MKIYFPFYGLVMKRETNHIRHYTTQWIFSLAVSLPGLVAFWGGKHWSYWSERTCTACSRGYDGWWCYEDDYVM